MRPGKFSFRNRLFCVACALVCALGFAGQAGASRIVARNASHVGLEANARGQAVITYRDDGKLFHLLAWGAINARVPPPSADGPEQVKFRLDYSGGWGSFHKPVWQSFRNGCQPYDGPKLAWFVAACKAPDGSYWALQSWQTALPDLGFAPWMPWQSEWLLHLSHWKGPLAQLDVYQDWLSGDYLEEVFGQYTYLGVPVVGFSWTTVGVPRDGYGRLVYIDTQNSIYGAGWRRDTSILTNGPPAIFCHGFYPADPYTDGYRHPPNTPHVKRGPGTGDRYRITVTGPGVTPDLMWEAPSLGPYDPNNPWDVQHEREMNVKLDSIRGNWRRCTGH